ncbi:hypothetical protein LJA01_11330 [Lactobacillus japonicus]|nr:hypothetical protein LJA01_11330 [Lactobacillus japonicus]
MKNENLVPKVRFKGFSDPWEQRKLGELSNGFTYGLNASAKAYDGKHQYLRITDIDDETRTFKQTHLTSPDIDFIRDNSYVLKLGDIVFTRTGASTGKTFIYRTADSIVYYAGFLIKMSVREDIDSEFVFQNTLTTSFNRFVKVMSQRSGQPGINSKEYARFKLYIPKLKEQVLVGNMLLLIDNLIAANEDKLEQLKTLKKLMMQKIFSQKWRFKGFTDPWEQRKLKWFLRVSKLKNIDGIFDKNSVLSVSGEFGVVNQIAFQGRSFAGKSILNYGILDHNDVVYTKSPLKSNPYGIIKTNLGKAGVVSTLYAVYAPLKTVYSPILGYYFNLDTRVNNYLRPLVNKGAKNDMKVRDEAVLEGKVCIPDSIETQKRICNLFSLIDNLIAANEDKLNQLKKLKKYLMQNMFV